MKQVSFKRHRFPPDVIRYAVWLYYRFTMSLRDVEDLLTERGIDVTYATVRCWANKFGPAFAANIRRGRGQACWAAKDFAAVPAAQSHLQNPPRKGTKWCLSMMVGTSTTPWMGRHLPAEGLRQCVSPRTALTLA